MSLQDGGSGDESLVSVTLCCYIMLLHFTVAHQQNGMSGNASQIFSAAHGENE